MGATLSSPGAVQNPEIKESWLLSHSDSALKHAHNATIEAYTKDGCQLLALAFQASEAAYEGSPSQHIRFAVSKDGEDDRVNGRGRSNISMTTKPWSNFVCFFFFATLHLNPLIFNRTCQSTNLAVYLLCI